MSNTDRLILSVVTTTPKVDPITSTCQAHFHPAFPVIFTNISLEPVGWTRAPFDFPLLSSIKIIPVGGNPNLLLPGQAAGSIGKFHWQPRHCHIRSNPLWCSGPFLPWKDEAVDTSRCMTDSKGKQGLVIARWWWWSWWWWCRRYQTHFTVKRLLLACSFHRAVTRNLFAPTEQVVRNTGGCRLIQPCPLCQETPCFMLPHSACFVSTAYSDQ